MGRRQRNDSGQREHGPSEELILNKDAGSYPACLRISKTRTCRRVSYIRLLQPTSFLNYHTDCRIENELEGRLNLKSKRPVERPLY